MLKLLLALLALLPARGAPQPLRGTAIAAGALAGDACARERVAELYSALPYPPRDAVDEIPGVVGAHYRTFEDVAMIRHVGFGGAPLPSPLRALMAGGGTGDATLTLALHLAQRGLPADITHLDLSGASIAIAQERWAVHAPVLAAAGVRVRWLRGSIEEGIEAGAQFDYVQSVGVLHHLPDPMEGLRALAGALAPAGVMQIMVYGAVGRTGLYHARELLRLAGVREPGPAMDAVLDALPAETNWFARNAKRSNDLRRFGPNGLADLLLHPCDVAYTVPDVVAAAAEAGLRVQAPTAPAEYEPVLPADGELAERLAALPWAERAAFAELQRGDVTKHLLWLAHADNPVRSADGRPWTAETVVCPAQWYAPEAPASPVPANFVFDVDLDVEGFEVRAKELPPLGAVLLPLLDCRQTLRELLPGVQALVEFPVSLEALVEQARVWQGPFERSRALFGLHR